MEQIRRAGHEVRKRGKTCTDLLAPIHVPDGGEPGRGRGRETQGRGGDEGFVIHAGSTGLIYLFPLFPHSELIVC